MAKEIPVADRHDFKILMPEISMDITSLFKLRLLLEKLISEQNYFIAIDMHQVIKIDSSTLGLLRNINNIVQSKNGIICLIAPSEEITDTLRITSLFDSFRIVKNMQEFDDTFSI